MNNRIRPAERGKPVPHRLGGYCAVPHALMLLSQQWNKHVQICVARY